MHIANALCCSSASMYAVHRFFDGETTSKCGGIFLKLQMSSEVSFTISVHKHHTLYNETRISFMKLTNTPRFHLRRDVRFTCCCQNNQKIKSAQQISRTFDGGPMCIQFGALLVRQTTTEFMSLVTVFFFCGDHWITTMDENSKLIVNCVMLGLECLITFE